MFIELRYGQRLLVQSTNLDAVIKRAEALAQDTEDPGRIQFRFIDNNVAIEVTYSHMTTIRGPNLGEMPW